MEQVLHDTPAVVKSKPADTSGRIAARPVQDTAVQDNLPLTTTKAPDSVSTRPAGDSIVAAGTPAEPPAITMPVRPKPDSLTSATTAPGLPPVAKSPDTSAGVKPRPRAVVKLSERKLASSVRQAYVDRSGGKKADTIILFIPVDTLVAAKGTSKPAKTTSDSGRVTIPPHPVAHTPAEIAQARPADTPRKQLTTKPSLPFINSDCRNFATDYDVDKLRVKLLETSKDEDRIAAARKVFKTRCFTTRQIRSLSEVFTTDAVKFRFLETAYPFCSDDQFRELSSLLADPVYIGKFRAMTEH
ncbi:MAG: DUF4476 domain-containing protein [Bacteroidetes bacterium]|nr:DUF4476 domain-containing protein [Bacteroidota bacterium]